MENSSKAVMERTIKKAEREYHEQHGNGYCLFKLKGNGLYEIAQRPLWYLKTSRFDSIVFNEIVMDLGTKSFYEACAKAHDMGYRSVINSCVERIREA